VTREDPVPVSQSVRLAGGEAVEMPLLRTRWLDFELPRKGRLESYDWVAFTSARALQAVVNRSKAERWAWPPRVPAAAVGDRTAHELQARGWMPSCVSTGSGARSLVESLQARGVAGKHILFPCSAIAEPTFAEGIRAAGGLVDVVPVYTTETVWTDDAEKKTALAQQLEAELLRGCVATCASPSAVRALVELAASVEQSERLREMPLVVMGPTTARAAADLRLHAIDAGGKSLSVMARRAVDVGRKGS
jgi:uroporphyrinogen-III synthase